MTRKSHITSVILAVAAVLAASLAVAPTGVARQAMATVYDSIPDEQYDQCVTRAAQNTPYLSRLAASFTVPEPTREVAITVPVAVEGAARVRTSARIQASHEIEPWSYYQWSLVPDDHMVLAERGLRVDAPYTPCGAGEVATVRFRTRQVLQPGEVYWFVIRMPARSEASLRWYSASPGTNTQGLVAQSQFVEYRDQDGGLVTDWWSDNPEVGYRAPAMRVDAR